MAKKILNNKVEFIAGGKSLIMKLSDKELRSLRHSSIGYSGDNLENATHGRIYNFSIYALLDYEWKSPHKRGRFCAMFPYKDYDSIVWFLVTE